jgi:hypothetical protein
MEHTHMAEHEHHKHELVIFVNRKRKTEAEGVKPEMTVNEIAELVGLTAETAKVQPERDGKAGPPLSGIVHVHNDEHFLVTRKTVEGGHE